MLNALPREWSKLGSRDIDHKTRGARGESAGSDRIKASEFRFDAILPPIPVEEKSQKGIDKSIETLNHTLPFHTAPSSNQAFRRSTVFSVIQFSGIALFR